MLLIAEVDDIDILRGPHQGDDTNSRRTDLIRD
jgi:hypothetical protein